MSAPQSAPLPMVLDTQDVTALKFVIDAHVRAAKPGIRRIVERRQIARIRRAVLPLRSA